MKKNIFRVVAREGKQSVGHPAAQYVADIKRIARATWMCDAQDIEEGGINK